MLSIWKTNRQIVDKDLSKAEMLFYYPSATIQNLTSREQFVSKLESTSEEDFLLYARNSLWYGISLFNSRYKKMRISIKCLLASLLTLILSFGVYIIYSVIFS